MIQTRLLGLAKIACIIGLGAGLYVFKGVTDTKGDALARLEQQIADDRAAIRALEAEIAYLEQPQRVERAAAALGLAEVPGPRIVPVSAIEAVAPLSQVSSQPDVTP